MKWFDKWIEKIYLKKHPMPKFSCSVTELKPVDIVARMEVDRHDLYSSNIDISEVRAALLHRMLPDIDSCMRLSCSEDIMSNTAVVEARLSVYVEEQGYRREDSLKIDHVIF